MEKRQLSSHHIGISIEQSDEGIEAIYFKLKDTKVEKSKEVGPNGEAIIDFDKNGDVVGIEMIEPGTVWVKLFNKIRKEYKIKELNKVKLDCLQEAFA